MKRTSRGQWWIFAGVAFLALAALRLLWTAYFMPGSYARAEGGELDLRQWDSRAGQLITLDGEWLFYPGVLLAETPGESVSAGAAVEPPLLVNVPEELQPALDSAPTSSYGYGSYRLRLRLDPGGDDVYAVRISSVRSASAVYVNGRLAGRSGMPAADKSDYTPRNVPYSITVVPDERGFVDLVVQVANYDYREGLGIARSVQFGTERAAASDRRLSEAMQQIVFVIFVLHALYAALLYGMGFKDRRLLYLAYVLLALTALLATNGDKLLLVWLPIDYATDYRLKGFLMATTAYALLQSLGDAMPAFWRGRARRPIRLVFALLALAVLLPLSFLFRVEFVYTLLVTVSCLTALIAFIRSNSGRYSEDVHLAIMSMALFHVAAWEIAYRYLDIRLPFYPIDLLIAVLALSMSWFKKYLQAMAQSRKLQSELQEADKRKDEFLANTSHELRNPLHGILSIAQGVLDRHRNAMDDKEVRDLELILSIGRRMSHMLGDLLDSMILKENGIQLALRRLSLQRVAGNVAEMLQFMLKGKPTVLINEIGPDCPDVEADENRLTQILFNLLHNAIKFTPEGTISVRAEPRGDRVTVVVADTGIGMDESALRRIFEPYEQVAPASQNGGGFGLGLGISKQLTELHGSALEVESKPGRGTVFRFSLQQASPLLAEPGEPADSSLKEVAASAVAPMRTGHPSSGSGGGSEEPAAETVILAVDDDPVNLVALANILGPGYEIVGATSGREALEKLDDRRWDLVIADVMMPVLSGYELTLLIRERFNVYELPILLLTAKNRPEDIEAGLLSGANDYAVKPVNAIEFRARVRALTGLRRLVNQRFNIEAALLQAQIKPHFILNTLTAVTALSELDNSRMRSLIHDFSNYLRASFNIRNSADNISLKNELELVRYYLNVEQERFGSRLTVVWKADETIPVKLPPLLIQPLVENAVLHGILKKNAGGTVTIEVAAREERVDIAVTDDGIGMSEERIDALLRGEGSAGIGLRNTNLRLRQNYGRSLEIRSKPGHGTTVSFSIDRRP
ncbi:ATP-binding protein [Cohnella cellulosilytica]|uniref:histidine kinase n=1 Tax=Cohnella cellulosilytica TaxID=986710 RepID=A0ABW2FFZ8_9BACL